jgi:L-fuconolactonase
MQVDAHQHFWRLDRGDYGWLTPARGPLYRDYLPAHLAPHLTDSGIHATILVQAAPTEAETLFLLELAKSTPFVAGVVGWTDLMAPDVADRLVALKQAGSGYLKGVRPMIQDIADPRWIASPSLDRAFDAMEALDLRFDALVRLIHLEPLLRRLEQRPGLKVVIDHAGKPDIAAGNQLEWSARLASIASRTTAMCKLSGLVTEARQHWRAEDLAPFVQHIIKVFGADRVMWGSDWPVLNVASDYRAWRTAAEQLVAELPTRDRDRIFGGTAAQFYDIETHARVT